MGQPPVAKKKTTYSVRRAGTDDERSQSPLLERPGILARPERKAESRWRVDVGSERVTLRSSEGTQIELDLEEARRIAEQILRTR